MANNSSKGRKNTSSAKKKNNGRSSSARNGRNSNVVEEPVVTPLIVVICTVAVAVVLFLSNLGFFGTAGDIISKGLFGIFGQPAYALPILIVIFVFAMYSVAESPLIKRRVICSVILYILYSMLAELTTGAVRDSDVYILKDIWDKGAFKHRGGGVIFGSLTYVLNKYISTVGVIVLVIILMLLCVLIMLGRETLNTMSDNSKRVIDETRRSAAERRQVISERTRVAREALDNEDDIYQEELDLPRMSKKRRGIGVGLGSDIPEDDDRDIREDRADRTGRNSRNDRDDRPVIQGEPLTEADRTPRTNKKVSGVANIMIGEEDPVNKNRKKGTFERDDIHEITVGDITEKGGATNETARAVARKPFDLESDITFGRGGAQIDDEPAPIEEDKPQRTRSVDSVLTNVDTDMKKSMAKASPHRSKAYKMPPISLLNKMDNKGKGSSKNELLENAKVLQDTLETFGVRAKVTDISQGPSVTRYELQPEVGVRVNKIVSLADDIKLSLAAVDIRIEAPIPGKSAVGIEIPNKESSGVGLRDLLEDRAFKDHESRIAFAVGKDIAGKTIVADIAKMPHMLIAGATGSGKSVCINTIIMSILYKAHPDEVKLIMIDPKVVELSVYNGIPHLMVPVVTDPKKAAAALNWGVAEMTERYKKFADMNVRDLKGYNKKIEERIASGNKFDDDGNEIYKLPQIVIIVDELADLMMVAAKEVEESICRLAQLARACGIHLILATQRPSVDVITGLIKANMPSRVAFAVSSGVDSRTILDMNGAEKLLGKGDMLFFPQGYPKPARIQGAFVSDAEVAKVVEFLTEQDYVGIPLSDIANKISAAGSSGSGPDAGGSTDGWDDLFADAGRFIISQDKASIGSLQRKFKIGFNRAARIVDQLCEAGVVGEENGTKPREILMSMDAFEQFIDENV